VLPQNLEQLRANLETFIDKGSTRTPFSDYLLTVNHFGVGSITHFLAVDPGCGVW